MGYITDINQRRLFAVDEEVGIGHGFLDVLASEQREDRESEKRARRGRGMPSYQGTFNLPAMHIYKIKKGKIYDIEAIGFTMPYGTKGWQ